MFDNIKKAREYLENVTPLKYDCGLLCGSLCCKNPVSDNKNSVGMWLFPGEDELYKNNSDYTIVHADGNNSYPFLLCGCHGENGEFCKRDERPLFCRFFPYFPLVTQIKRGSKDSETRYRIKIIIHPTALKMCPALNTKLKITSGFSRAVKKACYVMLNRKDNANDANDELKKYLMETGEYLYQMAEFINRVYKSNF